MFPMNNFGGSGGNSASGLPGLLTNTYHLNGGNGSSGSYLPGVMTSGGGASGNIMAPSYFEE